MENPKSNPLLKAVVIALIFLLNFKANGQIGSSCTSSAMNSFTPCLNYITGSSGNGRSSPTEDCCNSIKSLMSDSVNCGCLIITGNVPISLPFNRTLAISLPRVCKTGVPLQCKASGVPLPAPGPVLFGPTQAPIASAPISPKASMSLATAPAPPPIETTPDITPVSPPVASLGPAEDSGIGPVLKPSASSPSYVSPPYFLLLFLGIAVYKSY